MRRTVRVAPSAFHSLLIVLFFALVITTEAACGADSLLFTDLGDFRLESGQVIQNCRVGYRTFGLLNTEKSNAILLPTWFQGTSLELMDFVGPGKLADTDRYFVIAVDSLGNGVSSAPSTSKSQPGKLFPLFSISDMVNAEHTFLTEKLGIKHLFAVIGISMGGSQAFQWAVSHPDFMNKAVAIAGTPRQTSYDLLLWQAELSVINALPDQAKAMRIVANVHTLALWTPQYVARQTSPGDFALFLSAREEQTMRYNILDWAWQLRAMMAHDISRPFGGSMELAATKIRAPVLVIVSRQDHIVNPEPSLALAKLLKSEVIELTGDCGHLEFYCSAESIRSAVAAFLER